MDTYKFYEAQIIWAKKLKEILNSDFFMIFIRIISELDSLGFAFLITTFFWYCLDRKFGIRFFYILFISIFLNIFLKDFLALPRPCQIEDFTSKECLSTYGMPSGTAQHCALLVCVVFKEFKHKFIKTFSILLALLMIFSRFYLGLHFLSDFIGGIVIGCILGWFYSKYAEKISKYHICFFIFCSVSLLILFGSKSLSMLSFLLGIESGILLKKNYGKLDYSLGNKFFRYFSVISGCIFLYFLSLKFSSISYLFNFLLGIWFSDLGERVYNLCKFDHLDTDTKQNRS